MKIITRFAPSPTNNLHLGHVYSARMAYDLAKKEGGNFILRIEDIDPNRCKPEFTEQILDDLVWLGLNWDGPIRKQSEHLDEYAEILAKLESMGVVYPCFCTNKEIREEIERAGQAPHAGEHILYPSICKSLSHQEREQKISQGESYAMRLDMDLAIEKTGHCHTPLTWQDKDGEVIATPQELGDVVVARKDIGSTSYHISAVHDDHLQGVTHIVRGVDLLYTTPVHRILQALLGYETPLYHHHALLINPETGYRFAKRDNPMTIKMMREAGKTPEDVFRLVDQYAAISAAGS